MQTALITHPICEQHDMGDHHPESPLRLASIRDHLIASGLDAQLIHYQAPLVSRDALLRVHTPG
ncbi:MAG: histone deacetylase family protein, partial [Burkholderiales bacterium]